MENHAEACFYSHPIFITLFKNLNISSMIYSLWCHLLESGCLQRSSPALMLHCVSAEMPRYHRFKFSFFLIKTETPNNSVSKVPETNALDWLMQQWNVHKVREDFRGFQLRWSLNKWVLRLLRKMASDSAVLTLVGLCSTTEVLKQWRVVTLLRGHCLL